MKREMLEAGTAWKLGDNVTTDLIISGRYFHLRSNLEELAKHVLEDAQLMGTDKRFVEVVQKGDFIVAGRNFGLGSSREHAPTIIKMAGVGAILAKSFARIFFRNAINIGLYAIECDTDTIENGDRIQVDLKEGYVENRTRGMRLPFQPFPDVMLRILEDEGLVSHVAKHKGFAFAR